MKKPYRQSCCLFGDPLAMQNEWANDVSDSPNNFEVKIKSYDKTQAHAPLLDATFTSRWKAGQRIDDGREQTIATEAASDESLCFGP